MHGTAGKNDSTWSILIFQSSQIIAGGGNLSEIWTKIYNADNRIIYHG